MEKEKDNEKKFYTMRPDNDDWFDTLLTSPEMNGEIGPDEQAISDLQLAELSDIELEKILREALEEDWPQEQPAKEPEPFRDEEYRDTFGEGEELAQVFDTPQAPPAEQELAVEEEVPDEEEGPVRKVRPKKKKGYGLFGIPHLLSVAIWIVVCVAIGTSLGRLVWVCAADVLAFGRNDIPVEVVITPEDDIDSIATKLQELELIKYPSLFKFYAELSDAEEKIVPGTYTLNTLFDYHALVKGMRATSTYRTTVTVQIPEGYSCAQIFALLEKKGVCTVAELEAYAANGDLKERWFLEGIQRGNKYCLEGFLFPDTYDFYVDYTAEHALEKMLAGFENRMKSIAEDPQELLDKLNAQLAANMKKHGYGQSFIEEHKLSFYEMLTVASIVEKESVGAGESYNIASVFYNRLCYQSAYPYLNSDATVYYAIGGKKEGGLTAEDLQIDSPYNTYKYKGLPPGPISNPSLASIGAALKPGETSFYYFIYDASAGRHQFSSTLKEHQEWIEKLGLG